ncbi:hypothetical protein JCM10908_006202 [Rhodotorula pacifica]|uniref:uncharacterized protein n=1 Tax=Rhodotorula pacifica TaxID=1495444 RepID=UPI003175CC5A
MYAFAPLPPPPATMRPVLFGRLKYLSLNQSRYDPPSLLSWVDTASPLETIDHFHPSPADLLALEQYHAAQPREKRTLRRVEYNTTDAVTEASLRD